MVDFIKRNWKRILLMLFTVAVLVFFVILDPDLKEADNVLLEISPLWFLLALACMIVYYVGDTVMYLIGADLMGVRQPFFEGLLTTMIGFFYSAITPLASGGQPFQVVQMKKRGINVGTSTSILMLKFLSWHMVITIMGIFGIVLLWERNLFSSTAMLVMFIVGIFVHMACLFIGILLSIKPSLVEKAGNSILNFTQRVFLRKKPEKLEKMRGAWEKFVADYKQAMVFAGQHKGGMVLIILTGIVEVFSYMATTYFTYRGLGFCQTGFMEIVLVQIMLTISVAFIPLPGASIASEGGFYAVFTKYFSASRSVGMLIWRLLTYYMTIILGLIAVVIDGFRKKVVGMDSSDAEPNTDPNK